MMQHTQTHETYEYRRQFIRDNWETMFDSDLARELGISPNMVYGIRSKLGLKRPRKVQASSTKAMPTPPKPTGYTREQLAWAVEWQGRDPQAGLMLLQQREWERMA